MRAGGIHGAYAGPVQHLVVPTAGGPDADQVVDWAARVAGAHGTLVLISVLPGSLVEKSLDPAERGRRRREEENRAKRELADQIARMAPTPDCHVIALFGDVVSDTLLLARNLGADAVVMASTDPHLSALLGESPLPVVVVPSG